MEAQNNGNPYDNLCSILDMLNKQGSRTNAQVYHNGVDAMRVWMAVGSKIPFDEWLKCPATVLSKTGK